MRNWTGMTAGLFAIAACGLGCGEVTSGDEEASGDVAETPSAIEVGSEGTDNGVVAIVGNAIVGNALTAGALESNATLIEKLEDTTPTGDPQYPTKGHYARILFDYIYSCAMPSTASLTLDIDTNNDNVTEPFTVEGGLGLAPEWGTSSCSGVCRRWVSACVLARVNAYGVPIQVSLRGNIPALATTPSEEQEYTLPEGRFFGQIFENNGSTDANRYYACYADNVDAGQIIGRVCAAPGGDCGLEVVGPCSAHCNADGWCRPAASSGTYIRAIGTWMKPPPDGACGDGVCQVGETASCKKDCMAERSATTHDVAGSTTSIRAADSSGNFLYYAGITDAPSLAGLPAGMNPAPQGTRDMFLIKVNKHDTYLAARRIPFAAQSPVAVSADGARVLVAMTSSLRALNASDLSDQWSANELFADERFFFTGVTAESDGAHAVGYHQTKINNVWTNTGLQYRKYDSGGNLVNTQSIPHATNRVQAPLDDCTYAVAYRSGSTVVTELRPTQNTGCATSSRTVTLAQPPQVTDPIPVAMADNLLVAGRSASSAAKVFVGRTAPGLTGWSWVNTLAAGGDGAKIEIKHIRKAGDTLLVAGSYGGTVEFKGTVWSQVENSKRKALTTAGDGFVAAYDLENGSVRWVRTYGGPGEDAVEMVAVGGNNRVWGFGSFTGTALLEGTYLTATEGATDVDSMRVRVGPVPIVHNAQLACTSAACAAFRESDTNVYTSGSDTYGQLGNGGSATASTVRVASSFVKERAEVAAGQAHFLSLLNSGQIIAWGRNQTGQLGDGTTTDRAAPVVLTGIGNVTAIAAGADFSLAVNADGIVHAWGRNHMGQLGDGTTADRSSIAQVQGLDNVVEICAGQDYALAVKQDGTVWNWGKGTGAGAQDGANLAPMKLTKLSRVRAVACGDAFAAALDVGGQVWTWGDNTHGQLGDGTTTSSTVPVRVPGLSGIAQIAAGSAHMLARSGNGVVYAWGRNANGQVGKGTTPVQSTPVQVLTGAREIGAGGNMSQALVGNDLFAWGLNSSGQLGDGTLSQRASPVLVSLP